MGDAHGNEALARWAGAFVRTRGWEITPRDLPSEADMARAPELRGLENNALFRLMTFRREFGAPTIERPLFRELLLTPATAEDIVRGIWGFGAARRNSWKRWAIGAMALIPGFGSLIVAAQKPSRAALFLAIFAGVASFSFAYGRGVPEIRAAGILEKTTNLMDKLRIERRLATRAGIQLQRLPKRILWGMPIILGMLFGEKGMETLWRISELASWRLLMCPSFMLIGYIMGHVWGVIDARRWIVRDRAETIARMSVVMELVRQDGPESKNGVEKLELA